MTTGSLPLWGTMRDCSIQKKTGLINKPGTLPTDIQTNQ
jgi:hypothetical protein